MGQECGPLLPELSGRGGDNGTHSGVLRGRAGGCFFADGRPTQNVAATYGHGTDPPGMYCSLLPREGVYTNDSHHGGVSRGISADGLLPGHWGDGQATSDCHNDLERHADVGVLIPLWEAVINALLIAVNSSRQ